MAVIVGASVILADPIFQGLAISLMAGKVANLLISRMAVPVLCFMANRKSLAAERRVHVASQGHLICAVPASIVFFTEIG